LLFDGHEGLGLRPIATLLCFALLCVFEILNRTALYKLTLTYLRVPGLHGLGSEYLSSRLCSAAEFRALFTAAT